MELFEKYKSQFDKYEVNTKLRKAHFLAQIEAESGLVPKRESLYYKTIEGLKATFFTPFNKKPNGFVEQYLKNSQKCANYVYANRGGNGDEKSNDGFNYRGNGFLQHTFKDNYEELAEATGIDLVNHPELLLEEANATICALYFWDKHNLNELADVDNLDAISDIINIGHRTQKVGDTNGYAHRKELLAKWKSKIKQQPTKQ